MQQDGLFTLFELDTKQKDIRIVPFGDIHHGGDKCDNDRWQEFLRDARKRHTPNTYYFGMGDYCDFAAFSSRQRIKNANLHEADVKRLDKTAMGDLMAFAGGIEFMRGHIIGLIAGNHDWEFMDGKSGVDMLAQHFGTRNLGWVTCGWIRLENYGAIVSLRVAACHGKAGGKLEGTTINQVADLLNVCDDAHLYMMGHDHQRAHKARTRMFLGDKGGGQLQEQNRLRLKFHEQHLVRTGSFQLAYVPNEGGYISKALKRAASLGTVEINASIIRHGHGNSYKNGSEGAVKVEVTL